MNISNPITCSVKSISFSFYNAEDIKKLSVKSITNPQIFDTLDHPTTGGLYDPALGPNDKDTICTTCSLDQQTCPGHFGHIDLSVPVYNPITFRRMVKMLQSTCHYCHKLRLSSLSCSMFAAKFRLIQNGLLVDAAAIESVVEIKPRKKEEEDEDMEEKVKDDAAVEEVNLQKVIMDKIEAYLQHALQNSLPTKKNTLISDALRKVERAFLSSIPSDGCRNCKGESPKYRTEGQTKIFERPLSAKKQATMLARGLKVSKLFDEDTEVLAPEIVASEFDIYITPLTVKALLDKMWIQEKVMMDLMYGGKELRSSSTEMFFMTVVPVTPTRFRPVSKMMDQMFEHPQNIHLTDIIRSNMVIQDIQLVEKTWMDNIDAEDEKVIFEQSQAFLKKTIEAWIRLQDSVNFLIDSSKAPLGKNGKSPAPGVRQILEKKEGLFRKHMMGKRVNFACRSVISPDPYIETNEIGIPPVFAKKLTYPEPVTGHNFKLLRSCVINGPDVWPGATHVQNEDGSLIALSVFDEAARTAIANQLLTPSIQKSQHVHLFSNTNKKVYRHLRNGDFLLLNRQPTLHKPSIMAHTARVLPGEKTIRMHYANCNTYNADFDGDEMNAHFPQNEIARAEAMLIARTDMQYLVPTDGGVLRGLIQDHVDAGVDMCSRDSFFEREDYIQFVYAGLRESNLAKSKGNGNIEVEVVIGTNGRIVLMKAAVEKPKRLWTGKQIISTILANLTPADRNSLNLISKSKIPASMWGGSAPEEQTVLVMDGELLTGILDKSQFGASSNGLVHAVFEIYGPVYAGKLLSVLGRLFTAYLQKVGFTCRMDDLLLTEEGNKCRKDLIKKSTMMGLGVIEEYVQTKDSLKITEALEQVLRNTEKMAGLDSAMKAKTNKSTSEIISTCIPNKLYKPFPLNNMQVMTVSGAKGSSVNVSQISCLLGQQELEGKRVPTMISGKTLPSFKAFDTSARSGGYITGRFLTGIRPQEYYFHCMAGREGLIDTAVKTSRSGYLQRCLIKHLEGLKVHYDHTVRDSDGSVLQFHYGEDSLDVCKQMTLSKFDFNAMNYKALLSRFDPSAIFGKVDEESVRKYVKKCRKKGVDHGTLMDLYSPSKFIGAVSEKFRKELKEYIDLNPSKLMKNKASKTTMWSSKPIPADHFEALMNIKYMHSLVEPGESVGLVAAQSIGEPSTQMTLNTFHFAGFGAKNVTLGIPRLREIIMTASAAIKTPLMRLPLVQGVSDSTKMVLCEEISKLVLSQIMKGIVVTERLSEKKGFFRYKLITVRLQFWNKKDYLKEFSLTVDEVKKIIELKFLPGLERAIAKELSIQLKRDGPVIVMKAKGVDKVVVETARDEDGEEDRGQSDGEDDDGDASANKKKRNKKQLSTYDDEAEEVEESDEEDDVEVRDEPVMEIDRSRTERMKDVGRYVDDFSFDNKNGEWCDLTFKLGADTKKILMAALCETVCDRIVIHEVNGIHRCFPQQNESDNDKSVNLGTEGCNIQGIWDYSDVIDVNNIYTNDISAILHTYGVEAARSAITREIASVFGVYGIDVDSRHLSLIGDYMTFEGGYKPFNRMGMDSNPSPFTQMSYERTTHFLTTATLAGDFDPIDSPSAKIVMGQVVTGGTGAFDILQSLE